MGLRKHLCAFALAAMIAGAGCSSSTPLEPTAHRFVFGGTWHSAVLDTVWTGHTNSGSFDVFGDTLRLANNGGIYSVTRGGKQNTSIVWPAYKVSDADTTFGFADDFGNKNVCFCWADSIHLVFRSYGYVYDDTLASLYLPVR